MKKTKKFYLVSTNEEIVFGDTIMVNKFCDGINTTVAVTFTEGTVEILTKLGVIRVENVVNTDTITTLDCIERIASRKSKTVKEVQDILAKVDAISPIATLSILLKELAIILDKKYSDHISCCDEVFVISTIDGAPYKINTSSIKSFNNFAAFRNLEDVHIVHRVLGNYFKAVFRGK